MSDLLNESIHKAIAENLPQLAATELKTFIQRAEATEKKLGEVQRSLDLKEREVAQLHGRLQEQETIDSRAATVKQSLADLAKRELDMVHREAKLVAEKAIAEKDMALLVLDKFLRLPSVRTTLTATVGVPVEGQAPNQYNSCGSPGRVDLANQSEHKVVTPE